MNSTIAKKKGYTRVVILQYIWENTNFYVCKCFLGWPDGVLFPGFISSRWYENVICPKSQSIQCLVRVFKINFSKVFFCFLLKVKWRFSYPLKGLPSKVMDSFLLFFNFVISEVNNALNQTLLRTSWITLSSYGWFKLELALVSSGKLIEVRHFGCCFLIFLNVLIKINGWFFHFFYSESMLER